MFLPPATRRTDLVVETIGDEIVLYDGRTHEAHALSAVAARVWEASDGRRSEAEIARCTRLSPALVAQALTELRDRDLLEAEISRGPDRRTLLKTGAAVSLPLLITSAVLPAAAAALSGLASAVFTCADAGTDALAYAISGGTAGAASGELPAGHESNTGASVFLNSAGRATTLPALVVAYFDANNYIALDVVGGDPGSFSYTYSDPTGTSTPQGAAVAGSSGESFNLNFTPGDDVTLEISFTSTS